MKTFLKILLYVLCVLCVQSIRAATTNLITAKVTVTTATSNNFAFTLNGSTRTITNVVTAPLIQFLTNGTVAGSASNLYYHVASAGFAGVSVGSYTNGSNVLTFRGAVGGAMNITILSNWATVVYTTQTVSQLDTFRVPLASEPTAVATNHATEAVDGIDAFAQSKFATNSAPLGNFLSLGPQVQEASNKTFRASTIGESTVTNSILTNIIRINVTILEGDSVRFLSGTISNVDLIKITSLSGSLTALSNGVLYNVTISNSPSAGFTNLIAWKSFIASNAVIDGLTAANFSAPGTGVSSFQVGTDAIASGDFSLAIGDNSEATNIYAVAVGNGAHAYGEGSVAFGFEAVTSDDDGTTAIGTAAEATEYYATALGGAALALHMNSTAIGALSQTTASNQISLGTDTIFVSIPGELRDVRVTNSFTRGTNSINARLDFIPRANSALANGYNSGVVLGSNVLIKISGPSGAYTNSGFAAEVSGSFHILEFDNPTASMTLLNNSGLDVVAANRITTGTGALLNLTNNPAIVYVHYDSATAKWIVGPHSN